MQLAWLFITYLFITIIFGSYADDNYAPACFLNSRYTHGCQEGL